MHSSEDDSSEISDLEERIDDKILETLPWGEAGPKLSKDEIKLMNAFTYDKEPVKAWRQITDYIVMKECNEYRWYQISKFLGKFSGFRSSHDLYKNKSYLTNLIEVIICKNNCYFFPEKCFLKHGYDLKSLMKKSLHTDHNIEILFQKTKNDVRLKHETNGRPKLWELAEDIGFNTELSYDDDGYLQVDYSLLKEEFWKAKRRPCFVVEENKILNVVHTLLISTSKKQEEEFEEATEFYSQKLPGLNNPILKTMCFGPDVQFRAVNTCELKKDEKETILNLNVEHATCSELKPEKHWQYHHGEDLTCTSNGNLPLEGPICEKDNQIIYYPCNMKHCWICCVCTFCKLARLAICKDHKNHVKFNIKNCIIQENAQCQDHWIDHIENFDESEDIQIDLKIVFHSNQLKKNGRNYTHKTLKYSGLKIVCKKCRRNTLDHLSNHLTPHMQCKHCIFETKTMLDENFWETVCNVCGKVFKTRIARHQHAKRYDVPEQVCEVCEIKCSSKYNLSRHMFEQHEVIQGDAMEMESNAQEHLQCELCNKHFRYQRNLRSHVNSFHDEEDSYKCGLCSSQIKSRQNLKRHLEEQHEVFDLENPIHRKEVNDFVCEMCKMRFKRKGNLAAHMKVHSSSEDKFICTDCGKQFTTKFNFNRHQLIHTNDREKYLCSLCEKNFTSKGQLGRHMAGVHHVTVYSCNFCDITFNRLDNLNAHIKKFHK
jgi:hypothetical protein